MKILEHEKEENIRQQRNPMENSTAALKIQISNQTKFQQFVRRFFGETLCEASRHIRRLTRSTPCCEGSKSEIVLEEGIGGSKISCRGGKKIVVSYCHRTLELQMNGGA
ncbi:hypothetical protein AVEN_187553-1 [Araneus ventricosus]|uniref:Uncharacterized protein n=1 Tax=Araneus ventricosus TaxID=182803 RepID=A0A4Y2GQJ7_ARAVE|nr:hypothetical protein AVEN_187553-1 [Araneus ventricosus]